jgi:hypothetical protein
MTMTRQQHGTEASVIPKECFEILEKAIDRCHETGVVRPPDHAEEQLSRRRARFRPAGH